jgi:hypothetical protein
MKKLVVAAMVAAAAMFAIQVQPVSACGISKSAAYSQTSRHAHRGGPVHVASCTGNNC